MAVPKNKGTYIAWRKVEYDRFKTTYTAGSRPAANSSQRLQPLYEEIYVRWIRRFVWLNKRCHPCELDKIKIKAFLTYLASRAL